jgi:hypothetical protein
MVWFLARPGVQVEAMQRKKVVRFGQVGDGEDRTSSTL